jgi:two-component system response regulator HydG
LALLTDYGWPGNIRELEHCIERAVTLASGQVLTPDDLAPELRSSLEATLHRGSPTLEEVKRRYLAHVIAETNGNISRAATILGVDRRSLYRMLRRYGLRSE